MKQKLIYMLIHNNKMVWHNKFSSMKYDNVIKIQTYKLFQSNVLDKLFQLINFNVLDKLFQYIKFSVIKMQTHN